MANNIFSFIPKRHRKMALFSTIGLVVVFTIYAVTSSVLDKRNAELSVKINTNFWQMTESLDGDDLETAQTFFDVIKEEGNAIQQNLATFKIAHALFESGDYDSASNLYSQIIDSSTSASMSDIAKIRLAKTLQAQGQYDPALELVNAIN